MLQNPIPIPQLHQQQEAKRPASLEKGRRRGRGKK
jgi:hypothetical protein